MTPATVNTPTVNLVAKSQLARLLAAENMTIQHSAQAKTASFDTNKRLLILPIWSKASEDMYDMLVAHEVGHALITPREDVYMPVCQRLSPSDPNKFFPYLNIVEDIRVDNEIKDRYPGVRRSYFNAFKELMERDFFGIAGQDVGDLPFGDRMNLYTKAGQYGFLDVPFTDEERVVVDEALKVQSFDDVCAVAEKIWNMSAKRKDPTPTDNGGGAAGKNKGDDQTEGAEDGMGDDAEPSNGGGDQSNPGDSRTDKAPQGDQGNGQPQSGQGTPDNTQNNPSNGGGTGNSPAQSPQSGTPDLKTVGALANSFGNLTENNKYADYSYLDLPRLNFNNILFGYKRVISDLSIMREDTNFCGDKIFAQIQDRNKNFVANLVKQFEQKMAADECRRTRTAKSGQLDLRKIANYKFSDDLFVKNQIVADGKSHGMVFIMDWSGSMGEYLLPTVEQLIALCMFCRKMNIPFEVYAFTNAQPNVPEYKAHINPSYEKWLTESTINGLCSEQYSTKKTKNYYNEEYTDVDYGSFLRIHNFGMINFLSSKMNTQEFKNAAELFCQCARNGDHSGSDLAKDNFYTRNMPREYCLSSTPLNEAIYAGIELVNKFKIANRLDIVNTVILTDGEPTSSIAHGRGSEVLIANLPNRKQMVLRGNLKNFHGCSSEIEMLHMAELFRAMTGTNLISIRMTSAREAKWIADRYSNGNIKESERMMKEWKDNDFFSYTHFGYTESFVIDSKTEVIDDDDILGNVKNDASIGVITRAFIKGNAKKATSRVLLNRFSDLIAKKILA